MLLDDTCGDGTPHVVDDPDLADALLGLDGFKVLAVTKGEHEVVIVVERAAPVTGCWGRCAQAENQTRVRVERRYLAYVACSLARFGSLKRRWRCKNDARPVKT